MQEVLMIDAVISITMGIFGGAIMILHRAADLVLFRPMPALPKQAREQVKLVKASLHSVIIKNENPLCLLHSHPFKNEPMEKTHDRTHHHPLCPRTPPIAS